MLSSIYAVNSFPSKPYPGASYYNIPLKLLGTFKDNKWEYYDPFVLVLPPDSYDFDGDEIPDEFDPYVEIRYTGGEFRTPSGVLCDPNPSDIGSIKKVVQNLTDKDQVHTVNTPGFFFTDEGELTVFELPIEGTIDISLPPKATLFYCFSLHDADGDGIPNIFDTSAGYPGTGLFDSSTDPSTLLTAIDDGSENQYTKAFNLISDKSGLIFMPDGMLGFFKKGSNVNIETGSTVFFGPMIDGNSNGIPDPLETNLNYTGGPFTIPGSNITIDEPFDPRNILGSGCSTGFINSGGPFKIFVSQDGVYYNQEGEIGFFYAGEELLVQPGYCVFFGTLSDLDSDRIPGLSFVSNDTFDLTANYKTGNDFIASNGTVIPSALLSSMDDGSINNSPLTYHLYIHKGGYIVDDFGRIEFFNKNTFIKVPSKGCVFFSTSTVLDLPIDTDKDGIPDPFDFNTGYPGSGTFTTINGVSVDISLYLVNPDVGSLNKSGATYDYTPTKDGLTISPEGEMMFFKSNTDILVQDKHVLFLGDSLIDQDQDVIPDEFDQSITYNGDPYTSDSGATINVSSYISNFSSDKGTSNPKDHKCSFISRDNGIKLNQDGSLAVINTNNLVVFEKDSVIFFGDLIDQDGDGIPDPLDNSAGYGGSGNFTDSGGGNTDISIYLDDIDDGSTNTSGFPYTITTAKDGVIVTPRSDTEGQVTDQYDIIKEGVLFDTVIKKHSNRWEGSSIYIRATTGSPSRWQIRRVSDDFVLAQSGDITSGETLTDAVFTDYTVVGGGTHLTFFKEGQTVKVEDKETIFFGKLKDANNNVLPEPLETSANYAGSGPYASNVGFSFDPGSILSGCSEGSINSSLINFSFYPNREGLLVKNTGGVKFFKPNSVLNIDRTRIDINEEAFFGSTSGNDLDQDGIPDNLELNAGYNGIDPFSIFGKEFNILEFIENPDSGSINNTGFPIIIKPNCPGLIICSDSDPQITLPGEVTIPAGCVFFRCNIEDGTKSSQVFVATGKYSKVPTGEGYVDSSSDSVSLLSSPSTFEGFSIRFFDRVDDGASLALKSKPFVSTTNFSNDFEIISANDITLNNS